MGNRLEIGHRVLSIISITNVPKLHIQYISRLCFVCFQLLLEYCSQKESPMIIGQRTALSYDNLLFNKFSSQHSYTARTVYQAPMNLFVTPSRNTLYDRLAWDHVDKKKKKEKVFPKLDKTLDNIFRSSIRTFSVSGSEFYSILSHNIFEMIIFSN